MQDRTYFMLKRLHSLAGVVPLAGFVAFHLFENSHSVAGQDAFNQTVEFIRGQPYLYIVEIGLLTPLLFHALMGLWLARVASYNLRRYPTTQNIGYALQRATGIILLFFIGFHLYTTRFADIPSNRMFQVLADHFSHPLVAAFYVAGILSAAYHLSNGLWGFSVSWGIVTGQKSMDLAWKACMGVGVAVALMGLNAFAGFEGKGVDWFQNEKTPQASQAAGIQAPLQPQASSATAPEPVPPVR